MKIIKILIKSIVEVLKMISDEIEKDYGVKDKYNKNNVCGKYIYKQ